MSSYESNRDSAAQKTEEAKNVGQQKAGEAQQATKVRSWLRSNYGVLDSSFVSMFWSIVGTSSVLISLSMLVGVPYADGMKILEAYCTQFVT